MVIRKIGILNVQLVKSNSATCKHYRLKLSNRKFIILNFHFAKRNWQLLKLNFKFSTHKTQLATRKIICLNL